MSRNSEKEMIEGSEDLYKIFVIMFGTFFGATSLVIIMKLVKHFIIGG